MPSYPAIPQAPRVPRGDVHRGLVVEEELPDLDGILDDESKDE